MNSKEDKTSMLVKAGKYKLLIAIGCVFVVYGLVVAFAGPQRVLGNYLVDDSLYYYGISQHVAAGSGSVFDGINQTNGYHPLWMLVLVPVYWIFGSNAAGAMAAAICLQAALFAVVMWLLVRVGKLYRFSQPAMALSLLVIGCPLFFHLWVNGLESTLLGCFILAALWQYIRVKTGKSDNFKGRVLLGIFCGFAFLSRLDSVFLPLTIIAAEIAESISTRKVRSCFYRALAVSVMMLVIGGPYLLRNFMVFGHIMPVSGYMKTPGVSGSVARFGVDTGGVFWPAAKVSGIIGIPLWMTSTAMVIAVIAGVALIIAAFAASKDKLPAHSARAFGVYLIYCGIHYSYVALRMPQFCNTMWYYIPAILAVALSLGVIASAFAPKKMYSFTGPVCILLALIFAAGGGYYRLKRENTLYSARLEAAGWLAENMADKRGAAFDAGIIGYFSGGNVVNLDGLVNNLTLKEYADAGKLDQYLLDMEIDYVAQYMGADGKGKRARWLLDELGSVLGEKIYEKDFVSGSRDMKMCVFEVRR